MPEILGRLRTPRLPSAPATPVVGEMYYDTTTNKLFWWNGTLWVAASGTSEIYEQPAAPSSPGVGAIWIDTDDVPPAWASLVPTATVLPTNPVDGQEVYFIADATNGVIWHLRYNAGSASAYKWEYVGGPSLRGFYATNENLPTAWSSGQPSITVARAGEYDVNWSCDVNSPGQSQNYIAFYLDAVRVDAIVSALFMTANPQEATGSERNRVAIAAGQIVSMGFIRTGAAVSSAKNRSIMISPVRIS